MNCKLVLADGTELDNITMENNMCASQVEVTAETLSDEALETVRIVPDEGEETILRYAKTDKVYRVGDEWHFVLVGAGDDEIRMRQLQEENEMLTECILEMSEIIYAE